MRHYRHYLRPQVQFEVELQIALTFGAVGTERYALGVGQRCHRIAVQVQVVVVADDHQPMEVVGQVLRKTDDHLVIPVAQADPAELHFLVENLLRNRIPIAELAIDTTDQAHSVEGIGVDLLALVETKQQLARGNMENVSRHVESEHLSFIRDHGDKLGNRLPVNRQQVVFHLAVNR